MGIWRSIRASHRERLAPSPIQGVEAHPATLVGRGERTVTEWVAALTELADASRSRYRRATLPREHLWRIVEDARCSADERAGAAVALLRSSLDQAGRARLRIAAEASALPPLRVVLNAVGSIADDPLLVDALGACAPPVRAASVGKLGTSGE